MRICLLILLFMSLGCKATVELGSLGPVVLDEPLVVTQDEGSVPSNDSAGSVAPEEVVEPKAEPKSDRHWTYPGRIEDHLSQDHKVDVEGLSKEQMLDLHDSLHEKAKAASLAEPKKLRNTIVQYTIKNCRWCFYDRERVIPNWVKKGWNFAEPVDESAKPRGLYPRYEIYDANGNVTKHEGSLISWKP